LYTFDCTYFAYGLHNIAHPFSFDFNNHIIEAEKFVRF
jgi:hypothetical protein